MHTLKKVQGGYEIKFDPGSGQPSTVATTEDMYEALRLVNYLNGGTGIGGSFATHLMTGDLQTSDETQCGKAVLPKGKQK